MGRGKRQHRVRYDNPGVPVPDGDGGYTHGWEPIYPAIPYFDVEILPATVRDLERQTAGTITAAASHIVVGDYFAGVTIQSRVVRLVDGVVFHVTGLANRGERDVTMALFCQEQLT